MTTSTPEIQNAPKRPRISLTTPFFSLPKTNVDNNALKRKELPFTSPDTSDKEDNDDDEISGNTSINTIKPRNFKSMVI